MNDVKKYLSQAFGIEDGNVLVNWRPGSAAIVISLKSTKPDKVLREILKRLKDDAERQFSGQLPAFLYVHLADVTKEELLELEESQRAGTPTGIQRAVSLLLHRRPHLHTVTLMVDGDVHRVRQQSDESVQTFVREKGLSYFFRNPNHSLAGLPLLE